MSGLTELALAVVLGGGLALGLSLLVMRLPAWRGARLADRLAPYLRDTADPLGLTPLAAPALHVGAAWRAWRDALARALGGSAVISRRLRQAGWQMDAARFRARQLGWTLGGLIAGALVVVALAVAGRFSGGSILLPPIAAVAGAVVCDMRLTSAARARVTRAQEELPTVLEFLSLCLAAGEGVLDALRRVADVGSGELPAELRRVVLAVGTGSPLPDALTTLSRDLDIPALTRTVDHLVAALDRGAPLAQVLQAQATDTREDAKRVLIEQAGRKEILMLLPLVFLILPLSVLFAIFPGVFMLRVGFG
ncbi:type II secretion system F family protein [Microbacterium sp. zg.Y625]|uniref:type II secretion system F family protein n=1 Tax=Microbacterium jiangjiandongii TaxID=3049071 RepID=UPI00214C32AD|nr:MULTISPECIES: type II secretion system F family protein [unclassified Microbacterium]MCR2793057.1 type II secretion system F family protein [Microbacterium sp. zg.Y625]MCR2814301.1 type II secretion system F family protein [Microbacterium sp. zg.Y843]WIM24169.1 type II secretion system F family protein [Microbacterium sp. zg-Y625]